MFGIGRWLQAVRSAKGRFERKALILLYHRVAEVDSDPWSLCVTPQHFAEQLEVMQKHTSPMRLQRLSQGQLSRRATIVTFDDGYADNLHHAKQLLERYDVPATVFLATGYLGHEREFWWDELERLLLQPGTLPEALCLSINGGTYTWDLGEVAHYSEEAFQRHRSWRAWEEAPSARHALYRSLWERLQSLPESERRKVQDELLASAGAGPEGRPTHRPLSCQEVVALAQGELIEVGSHTVTHPVLSGLPAALQRIEIQQSKAELEEILGHQITSFAYPYGDYTAETVAIVKRTGFGYACSTLAGVLQQNTDYFQLPRVQVHDWDGEQFARWLRLIQAAAQGAGLSESRN